MDRLRILRPARLMGETQAGTAKNAILPILAASLLCQGEVVLTHVPHLLDVDCMQDILRTCGVRCTGNRDTLLLQTKDITNTKLPDALTRRLRSSIFMLGPLLAVAGMAQVAYPGGCEIGLRPIDLHLLGLQKLGAQITESGGEILCKGKLHGAQIHLDYPSVGATENIMMAACLAQGDTQITNVAQEPEIEDLQNFLNQAGAVITGAGTPRISIHGVARLHGLTYRPIADRIVAGTLLCGAAMSGGDVLVTDASPLHLASLLHKLQKAGACLTCSRDGIRLVMKGKLQSPGFVETLPYPGFPTDLQSPMMALCCVAEGTSLLKETVFESRFGHVGAFLAMGAKIRLLGNNAAVITGVPSLHGATVEARDLRGGAALVLAGLCAQGETFIEHASLIERGYMCFAEKLRSLGADVQAVH